MPDQIEILLEGSYHYFDQRENYSQENFKFVELPALKQYHVYSEIISRRDSGEFLKILVRCEMNQHQVPFYVRIEKFLGQKYALETFRVDLTDLQMKYVFKNSQGSQEFTKSLNAKHHLTTPAFVTSVMFMQSKKLDPTARTSLILIGSPSDWTYEGPPTEKLVYVEYIPQEIQGFKINGTELAANRIMVHEQDSHERASEEPVEIDVSKYYGVPYQMLAGDKKIVIKNLKKNF